MLKALVEACRRGDAEGFYELAYPYDEYPNFWPRALRAIVRDISEVTPDIQDAFLQVWVQTKMLGLRVDNNRMLCRALRVLMPGFKGEAVRPFRGASAGERRRAAYGVSWTSSLSTARGICGEIPRLAGRQCRARNCRVTRGHHRYGGDPAANGGSGEGRTAAKCASCRVSRGARVSRRTAAARTG